MRIMTSNLSDCYQTPQWLFDLLNEEFRFAVDACAIPSNKKCNRYIEDATNRWADCVERFEALSKEDRSIFMNPPYSNPGPFLERAWEFSKHMRVVCLVRDDPSTKWYQKLKQRVTGYDEAGYYDNSTTLYPMNMGQDLKECCIFSDEPLVIIRLPERLRFEASEDMYKATPNNFRRTEDGRIECKNVYNFPCCIMIFDRRYKG